MASPDKTTLAPIRAFLLRRHKKVRAFNQPWILSRSHTLDDSMTQTETPKMQDTYAPVGTSRTFREWYRAMQSDGCSEFEQAHHSMCSNRARICKKTLTKFSSTLQTRFMLLFSYYRCHRACPWIDHRFVSIGVCGSTISATRLVPVADDATRTRTRPAPQISTHTGPDPRVYPYP